MVTVEVAWQGQHHCVATGCGWEITRRGGDRALRLTWIREFLQAAEFPGVSVFPSVKDVEIMK